MQSEDFIKECRQQFSEKVQSCLLRKETYKLVEALEDTMDFWRYGKHMFDMPVANSYIPVRNTIMKKPNLLDEDLESDELGYRYMEYEGKDEGTTRRRFHPMEPLSPLRGSRMAPGKHKTYDRMQKGPTAEHPVLEKTYFKWKRLSHIKDNGFSTLNRSAKSVHLFTIPELMGAFSPFRQQ